jgi:hypothetical protein
LHCENLDNLASASLLKVSFAAKTDSKVISSPPSSLAYKATAFK